MRFTIATLLLIVAVADVGAETPRKPLVLDPGFELELIASEPLVATPVALAVDGKGRIWFIESHTHFRPPNYKGPAKDRIQICEMVEGKPRITTFHQGFTYAMGLLLDKDGSVIVVTRNQIVRLRDKDGDGKADDETNLARLETKGNYPHNGLAGLTFDLEGNLLFGMGENLGEPYRLIGSDGTELKGGGEGGNVYRMKPDGSKLLRIATGVWNPFGLCVDPMGRIFCVENDPDARPPCRLLQIVGGGDYGFQFRYGRAGTHPLQAWDGELPGTLPMIAGTGEAPCTVLAYRGELWATSWGDNRIERFALKQDGASWKATRNTVIQGDERFRPTGMAVAPNGDIWFADWVDRSYTLHNFGRLWRLKAKKDLPSSPPWPPLNEIEKQARVLETKADRKGLDSSDAFTRQAAVWGMIQHGEPAAIDWPTLPTSGQRLGVLQALRWRNEAGAAVLPAALADADPDIRLLAVRWIADEGLVKYRDAVLALASNPKAPLALAKGAIAATAFLDAPTRDFGLLRKREQQLCLQLLDDPKSSPSLRAYALRSLPVDHAALTIPRLKTLIDDADPAVSRAALWTAILSSKADRDGLLAKLAEDGKVSALLRADAVSGLSPSVTGHKQLLTLLAGSEKEGPVNHEVKRLLRQAEGAKQKPPFPPEAIDSWIALMEKTPGDADTGRRVFFGRQGPACARCHAVDGRGGVLGPDLSQSNRQPLRRLLESILQPSREVAPQYQPVILETADGRVLTGVSLGKSDGDRKERFLDAEGKEFTLATNTIESRRPSLRSIMIEGLEQQMTVQELRDLLAYLQTAR